MGGVSSWEHSGMPARFIFVTWTLLSPGFPPSGLSSTGLAMYLLPQPPTPTSLPLPHELTSEAPEATGLGEGRGSPGLWRQFLSSWPLGI